MGSIVNMLIISILVNVAVSEDMLFVNQRPLLDIAKVTTVGGFPSSFSLSVGFSPLMPALLNTDHGGWN